MVTRAGYELRSAFGWPAAAAIKVPFTGTAGRTSAALADDTSYLMSTTEDAYVAHVASDGAATTSVYHWFCHAGVQYVVTTPYEGGTGTNYISAIQKSAGGDLHLTRLTDRC